MTSFILKIIGMLSMLCDHIGVAIVGHTTFLNSLGRMAFPIFAFQIAQGYIHTKDLKKYILRLFIFALISQIPFTLFLSTFNGDFSLNVFFTFLFGIFAIYAYNKIKNPILSVIYICGSCLLAQLCKTDYGAFGVASIFIFYLFIDLINKENITSQRKVICKLLMCLSFIFLVIFKYLPDFTKYAFLFKTYLELAIFTCIPLILFLLYNGKQGPKIKYFFYVFYPLHLIILWLIHTFL